MRLFAHFVGRVDVEVLAHICETVGGDMEDLGIEGYLKWKYSLPIRSLVLNWFRQLGIKHLVANNLILQ